jgi:hypothetical protein
MQLFQKCALLGLVAAVPAAAHALLLPTTNPCFTSGTATYRISAATQAPDYRVRIDNAAAHPDLRVGLVDQPEIADFVLVDDLDAVQGNACAVTTPPKTIRVDAGETLPDLTVSLSQIGAADASDFKLYVRSARFSQEDAAALFGVMWRSRSRSLAQR